MTDAGGVAIRDNEPCKRQFIIDDTGDVQSIIVNYVCSACGGDGNVIGVNDTFIECGKCLGVGHLSKVVYKAKCVLGEK